MTGKELFVIWHSKVGIREMAYGQDWDRLPDWFQQGWNDTAETLNNTDGFQYVHPVEITKPHEKGGIDVVIVKQGKRKRFVLF